MADAPFHHRLLAMTLALPGAYEDRPWGSVHCKVDGKIFVGWGRDEDGTTSIGFKTDKDLQAMLVSSDPRFKVAKYVGKHGWVDMKLGTKPNWGEVEQFIVESFRMIAPRTRVKALDAAGGGAATPGKASAKKAAAKKAAPKKAAPKKAAPKKVAPKKAASKKVAPKKTASARR